MIDRPALIAAASAAAVTLVLALGVVVLAPAVVPAEAVDASVAPAAVDPTPTVQVDTVYLAAPEAPATIVVHESGHDQGDDAGEHESGDDD